MQPPITDQPDETWVKPRDLATAYNIPWDTARSWRSRQKVRGKGNGQHSRYHLGDFREQAAQYHDRAAGRDVEAHAAHREAKRAAMDTAIIELFEQPLTPGECAHIGCPTPRDTNSITNMCPHHDQKAQRPKHHTPTRCWACQYPITERNALKLSGLCTECASRSAIQNRHTTTTESEYAA